MKGILKTQRSKLYSTRKLPKVLVFTTKQQFLKIPNNQDPKTTQSQIRNQQDLSKKSNFGSKPKLFSSGKLQKVLAFTYIHPTSKIQKQHNPG